MLTPRENIFPTRSGVNFNCYFSKKAPYIFCTEYLSFVENFTVDVNSTANRTRIIYEHVTIRYPMSSLLQMLMVKETFINCILIHQIKFLTWTYFLFVVFPRLILRWLKKTIRPFLNFRMINLLINELNLMNIKNSSFIFLDKLSKANLMSNYLYEKKVFFNIKSSETFICIFRVFKHDTIE